MTNAKNEEKKYSLNNCDAYIHQVQETWLLETVCIIISMKMVSDSIGIPKEVVASS